MANKASISSIKFKTHAGDLARAFPFVCPYCPKRFNCSQALGGHINAHRQERYEARRERRAIANARRKLMAIAPLPRPMFRTATTSRARMVPVTPSFPPMNYRPIIHHQVVRPPFRSNAERRIRAPHHMMGPGNWTTPPTNAHNVELDLSLRLGGHREEEEVTSKLNLRSPQLDLTLAPFQPQDEPDLTLKL
ncbi:protein LATE FLOWERING-like [Magnolia sinica]|uniref:protein LATE FLOWERING-like n=1 Tax=Magnolia sinica TaxID=86752 RepID=UPI00265847B0|nr:protein LATE FLOWERING-like [Magnolia sinica]